MSAPSSGSRRAERWRQIDQLCDRFEQGWAIGAPPEIEALLAEVAPEDRSELLRSLLELLRELRQQTSQPLTSQEAVHRFAPLGSWAVEVLEDLGLAEPGHSFFLEVQTGARAGHKLQLTGHSTLRVGRGPGVDLELAGDAQLSRAHFCVEYNPPHAYLTDLRSRNGTFLNDQAARQARLRDGDRIRAGHTLFRVVLREGLPPITEAATTPPQTDCVDPVWPAGPAQLPVPGYDLEAELGQGGMGRVYRARRARDGQTVAVKIIIPHAAPRPRTIARFQREMRILGRLDHPNIVRLLESGETDGHLYFVMEHVAGCNAGAAVQRAGPLPADRVVRLGCQLLDALAYAHSEGVIHRDIKPANLLLTQTEGREILKLADFGLARAYRASAMSGLTLTGEMAGTPAFMPPEQVRDLRSVRPPADQYAVAATLYYLLTGAGVYEPEHGRIDLLMRIVDTDPIPLRNPYNGSPLPGRLLEVIRRGLARQPQDRYPDVPAMREALASSL